MLNINLLNWKCGYVKLMNDVVLKLSLKFKLAFTLFNMYMFRVLYIYYVNVKNIFSLNFTVHALGLEVL